MIALAAFVILSAVVLCPGGWVVLASACVLMVALMFWLALMVLYPLMLAIYAALALWQTAVDMARSSLARKSAP